MKPDLNIQPIENWLPVSGKPVIIAGPCSAESADQVLTTARGIARLEKVKVFRAGIWKPRTRPNSFEGVGEEGLKWMKAVKEETGMLLTTEVANAEHVELCLKYGIDILWIGARTTVNPFSVQEIANALKGVDIPVMVKNPINPDLQLWLGALERVQGAGITKLAAIHRGFSPFEKTPFRNIPKWELAIEMRRMLPNLPMICDPSHIAGSRELLPYVCQKAMDLDMTGLMIETHIQPKVAKSDAEQQVTPEDLGKLLSSITVRRSSAENLEFKSKLDQLRAEIDKLDDDLLQVLSTRMKVAEKIGEYKRDNEVTILQLNRWEEIMNKRLEIGQALGLSTDFTKQLYQMIHKESIRKQEEIMNSAVKV
ncbi:MAG: bifunctional 3-deoxy-7-phosphoheptulonate synthase/chorismate mutase type II [Flavobacteriales bacterium]|nr:bifunctional 3-deoxy-7-phosphoheptulonate synthase/chorismate mutase type II [Flavobacteriales bacterium]MCB9449347.1 bifunctional 3-deoxy-7-phosphoheptulonate synthase/chorismate mutase type II [Flavobacteriales bacterium]